MESIIFCVVENKSNVFDEAFQKLKVFHENFQNTASCNIDG